MRTLTGILLLLLAPAACMAGVDLKEDEPLAPRPKSGSIAGVIRPGKSVLRMHAVERATNKRHAPAMWKPDTGEFVFKDLPGGRKYDLCFETDSGRNIEGINLDFVDARLLRLAAARRKQLGLPPEGEHAFTKEDVAALKEFVAGMKDFLEQTRVLYIHGHGRRATMIVERMRTREFHASGADLLWRVELWYFTHERGGWQRVENQELVLERSRTRPGHWRRISVEYYPQLSVQVDEEGKAAPVDFTIPKPDLSRGRLAGTEPEVSTETHLLGVEEAEGEPRPEP